MIIGGSTVAACLATAAVSPSGARAPQRDDDFVVTDGGIVDNIPLGRALDAIVAAAADGPTRRVLVYLHPTGPPPPAGPAGAMP
jgi:hypothetical protein